LEPTDLQDQGDTQAPEEKLVGLVYLEFLVCPVQKELSELAVLLENKAPEEVLEDPD